MDIEIQSNLQTRTEMKLNGIDVYQLRTIFHWQYERASGLNLKRIDKKPCFRIDSLHFRILN